MTLLKAGTYRRSGETCQESTGNSTESRPPRASFESVRALMGGHEPDTAIVGIILAAASLVIMPFLSWAQRRTGKALGSNAVVVDSIQTLLCTYLSAVLLVGLVLNATLGWSWADPIAGLIIAAGAIKEGRKAR